MKGNIFTGNQQPSAPNKIFTFNPTNSVNLLGQNHNQAPNQNNQNAQNQPLFNVPLQNNIANSVQNQNPLVTDSLKENHSFVDIRNKVYNRQTLTDSEINFFKMGGLKYFKKDESKSNYFKNVKSKEPHLGFGQDIIIYRGEVPKSEYIDAIWKKIIKHLAFVWDTHQMNGYFLLKPILKQTRLFQRFYKARPGLDNKVFEIVQEFVRDFYVLATSKPNINKNGLIYQELVQKLVLEFYSQFIAYLNIISLLAFGQADQASTETNNPQGNVNQAPSRQSPRRNQAENPDHRRGRRLMFKQLEDDILLQLWEVYKQMALSSFKKTQNQTTPENEDNVKNTVFKLKKVIFLKVGQLIGKILQKKFNQQKIMKKHPLRLNEVIAFINTDLCTIRNLSLLEPIAEEEYTSVALNIVLFSIPFTAFSEDKHLKNFFELQISRQEHSTYLSLQQKKKLLDELIKLQIPTFMALRIWALKQKSILSRPSGQRALMRQHQNDRHEVEEWEQLIRANSSIQRIFQEKKWRFFVCLLIQKLNIQKVIESQFLRCVLTAYFKRMVKGRSIQFFEFSRHLSEFQDYMNNVMTINLPQENQSQETQQKQSERKLISIGVSLLNYFDIFKMGIFLKQFLESNFVDQVYGIFITLLRQQKISHQNYTEEMFKFIEGDQQQKIILMLITSSIATKYKIKCTSIAGDMSENMSFNSDYDADFSQNVQVQQQIKLICQLIKKNTSQIKKLEDNLFQRYQHQYHESQSFAGLKISLFLCQLIDKINICNYSEIKCLRYIISAIDSLFNYEPTRSIILYAISICFPYQNTTLKQRRSHVANIMSVLSREDKGNFQGEEKRQVRKLRLAISYHLNHMIRYSDSIDEYFTLEKFIDSNIYQKIQKEIKDWNFKQAYNYLRYSSSKLRSMDWFYSFAGILQFKNIQAIDIDSIILLLRKLRIKSEEGPSFIPMCQLVVILQKGDIAQKILQILKPAILKKDKKFTIKNNKLLDFEFPQVKVKQFDDGYSKYKNKDLLMVKNKKLKRLAQKKLIQKIYLSLRLLEEILKLRRQEQFEDYILMNRLNFMNELIAKMTIKQQLHKYELTYISANDEVKTSMNLPATVVSLLELYRGARLKTSQENNHVSTLNIMANLDSQYVLNTAQDPNYENRELQIIIESVGLDFEQVYKQDKRMVNALFFDNILFQVQNSAYQRQNSLKGIVIAIVQLMIQNNAGGLLHLCLDNFEYPITSQDIVVTYNPYKIYMSNDQSKSLKNLLYSCLKQSLPSRQTFDPNVFKQPLSLSLNSKVLECLYVMLRQKPFYDWIQSQFQFWNQSLACLLAALQQIQYELAPQINLLNKISLFVLQFLTVSKDSMVRSEFKRKILQNFLISPQNLLKKLYTKIGQVSRQYKYLQRHIYVKSSQTLSNYVQQMCLVRNALFRSTFHVLIRIFFVIKQDLSNEQFSQLFVFLFKNLQAVKDVPYELIEEPAILSKLNLFPHETKQLRRQDQNIKTIVFSDDMNDFSYCLRSKSNKFGPNFMYNVHVAFHRYKIYINSRAGQSSGGILRTERQMIRGEIFFIQLINCLNSLKFAYEANFNAYLQLMTVVSNLGYMGQNMPNHILDQIIPKTYEKAIFLNKYVLANGYSFEQGLHSLSSRYAQISTVQMISMFLIQLCGYLDKLNAQDDTNFYFDSNPHQNRSFEVQNGFQHLIILRKKASYFQNSDYILKMMINFIKAIPKQLLANHQLNQSYRSVIDALNKILNLLLQRKNKYSLRVLLMGYESILEQSIILFTRQTQSNQRPNQGQIHSQNRMYEGMEGRRMQNNLTQREYLNMQRNILSSIVQILTDGYQIKKLTSYLPNYQPSQNLQNLKIQYSQAQVQQNVSIICQLCMSILNQISDYAPHSNVFSQNSKTAAQKQIIKTINYIIKLLVQNIETIQYSISRISIFALCNKFYLVNQHSPFQIWPFYQKHLLVSEETFVHEHKAREDQLNLQILSVIDTYCFLALQDEKSFNKELIRILLEVINVDEDFIRKQKSFNSSQINSKYLVSRHNQQNQLHRGQKPYDFRHHFPNQNLRLYKLIEYKKMLIAILAVCIPQNWQNLNYSPELNSMFLQILHFRAIEFNLQKFVPFSQVEKRLKNLMVYENQNLILSKDSKERPIIGREYQLSARSLLHQRKQNMSQTSMSLFDFIGFVHHNEFVYHFLLLLKTGFNYSQIMLQIGGPQLSVQEFTEIWKNVDRILLGLYDYYADYVEIFLDNVNLMKNITILYNYINEESSYMVQFQGLTLFFDKLGPDYIKERLVHSVIQYCALTLQVVDKWRQVQWKTQSERDSQKLNCLSKCLQLIQKSKVINSFKELGYLDKQHGELKRRLTQEIISQKGNRGERERTAKKY